MALSFLLLKAGIVQFAYWRDGDTPSLSLLKRARIFGHVSEWVYFVAISFIHIGFMHRSHEYLTISGYFDNPQRFFVAVQLQSNTIINH